MLCCFLLGGGKRTQINDRPEVIGHPLSSVALLVAPATLTRSLLSATSLSLFTQTESEIGELSLKLDASPARAPFPEGNRESESGAQHPIDCSSSAMNFEPHLIVVTKFRRIFRSV